MITVTVTPRDIVKGKQWSACGCPVALALRRATGRKISVGPLELADEDETHVDLPAEVVDFIRRFDRGEPVEPFRFEIDLWVEPFKFDIEL